MDIFKRHSIKICMIFLLAVSLIICIYAVGKYKGDTGNTRGGFGQFNSFQEQRGGTQNGQFPGSDSGDRQQGSRFDNSNQGGHKGFANGAASNNGNSNSTMLAIYSVIFIGVFSGIYAIYKKRKVSISSNNKKIILLTILCMGLFLRIALAATTGGFSTDISLFKSWATAAANNLSQVYSNSRSVDYPPLYMYVLFIVGKIAGISSVTQYYTLLLKLPSIMADIISAFLIYKLSKKYLSSEMGIMLSAFYVFNPAIFINSTLWGQVDSFFTLIIISAVFLLSEKKIGLSAMLFTAAVLMKPQGIIFLPVLFFELVRQKSLKKFVKAALIALATAAVIIIPFSMNNDTLWIFKLYSNTVSEYPYASVNAFNFFSLIGANYTKDSLTMIIFSYHTWGMIFIVLITLFSWFICIKGKSETFAAAAALTQIAGVFTFSVGMHERYLFPAAALSVLTFIYLKDKRIIFMMIGFSITSYLNTNAVLYGGFDGMHSTAISPILVITSLLNVLLFGYLVKILYDIAVKKRVREI